MTRSLESSARPVVFARKAIGANEPVFVSTVKNFVLKPNGVVTNQEIGDEVDVADGTERGVEKEGVLATTPGERVIPSLTIQDVVARPAVEAVPVCTAKQRVVAPATVERVIAAEPVQRVGTPLTRQHVLHVRIGTFEAGGLMP